MSKDEYYNSPESRLDTVLGDHKKFFELLQRIRSEYRGADASVPGFPDWLLETYGIQLNLNSDGRITSEYTIVDHDKYLICMLKHGG